MDAHDPRGTERDGPRELGTTERFLYVFGVTVALGVAVTFRLAWGGDFELWMVIPGSVTSFVTAVAIWWFDGFRYMP